MAESEYPNRATQICVEEFRNEIQRHRQKAANAANPDDSREKFQESIDKFVHDRLDSLIRQNGLWFFLDHPALAELASIWPDIDYDFIFEHPCWDDDKLRKSVENAWSENKDIEEIEALVPVTDKHLVDQIYTDLERELAYEHLRRCGVPFDSDGEPLGIG